MTDEQREEWYYELSRLQKLIQDEVMKPLTYEEIETHYEKRKAEIERIKEEWLERYLYWNA